MQDQYLDYIISDDKQLIQIDRVLELLSTTYWANKRAKNIIEKSIQNSLCFGVYKNNIQVGFARCVTDYATVYYICDVVIDSGHRGQGLGKKLMRMITEHEDLKSMTGILGTKDAHGLYEQFGFARDQGSLMRRMANQVI
jgi:GNAT superfamily N-acetyltransferase